MKVLQFINSLTAGGAEKLLVDAVLTHHKNGVQVDILTINGDPSPFLDKLKNYPEIQVFSLGVDVNVYNPKYILQLNRYFENYDIIHVHLFPAMYWAALARLLSSLSYRLIFTEHNTTNRRRNSFVFKILDKFFYKQFNKIVTISDAVDAALRNHLGPSFTNITKIYNGIDLEEINSATPYSKAELGFSSHNVIVIQVSSFTPQKNQGTLIRAMALLPEAMVLLLVGDGPLRVEHELLAKSMGLSNRVFFLGIRKDVPRLLKSVDYVVLSSHFEGLSLSSVEGLASGKPFLSSDVPGLTEVVKGAGLLFPDGDSEKLKGYIEELHADRNRYDSVVNECMERASRFDIHHMTLAYFKLYNESLANYTSQKKGQLYAKLKL